MFLQNLFTVLNENNNKRILIFTCTSILAIHSLIFIHSNSVNFALSDDWAAVFAATYYLQNDPAWIDPIITFGNEHVLLFYRIVMFVGLLLNSFNIQQFAYLNWGFLSIGVWIFYQILKKTDNRLTWLIIPISALMFSPKMIWTELSASIGLTWVGTFFFIVSVVGVTSKEKLTKTWFCLAIFLAIVASLSSILGLLSWIAGISCLLLKGKENRKYLIFWFLATIVVFSVIISTGTTQGGRRSLGDLIQPATIFWGLEYISNPYSVGIGKYFVMDINGTNIHQEKFSEIRILIGMVSLLMLIFIAAYFLKRKIWRAIPWITFGAVGILSAILTTIGRFGLRLPSENYFIIISIFTQISLFVLITMLFLEIKKSNKQKIKNATKITYILLILSMFVLLGSSYFAGLRNGPIWHDEKSSNLQCFDLPSNIVKCEFRVFGDVKQHTDKLKRDLSLFNFLIERKLSIFNEEFFSNQEKMRERLNEKWNQLDTGIGIGQIQTINEQSVDNGDQIDLNRPIVHITGWTGSNNDMINEVVFFVDKKLFFSITPMKNELENLEKNKDEQNSRIEWDVQFFSGFIENGCHDFSIGGITDNSKFMLEQQIIVCKTKLIYDPNPNW
jgi:hypothetical protein